jgi:LysM repeat protein
MNETTSLNSELLSADARGRKHIPFAVFAVILIHVVLFLVLLIAAGCRAKARARQNVKPATEMLAQKPPAQAPIVPFLGAAAFATNAVAPAALPAIDLIQPVLATEPPVEKTSALPTIRKAAQKTSPAVQTPRPTATKSRKPKVYVVKAGDNLEKIAKMHRTSVEALKTENNLKDHMLLRPGQQLRVSSQKVKTSNEV